ncbi:hypothetical protein ACLI09_14540, partial [Flavobacterium sp. RHBU_24]|uniref:hypothetical protein n=1 Tax=Flavobacterium sp. RHBU_24 TaxID=3391185 RepID=UPI003984D813
MKKIYFVILISLLAVTSYAQSAPWIVPPLAGDPDNPTTGNTTDPICGAPGIDYENLYTPVNGNNGNMGPIGCLGSTPNGQFSYIPIGQSGNFVFNLEQETASGVGIDVDFILWGPFTSMANAQFQVQSNPTSNIVDCSYSAAAQEEVNIYGAVAGQYYMILITNFNGSQGTITFEQENLGEPGAGIALCPCDVVITPDFMLCEGDTAVLTVELTGQGVAEFQYPTTYQWSGPNGVIVGATANTLTVSEPGTYTAQLTNAACDVLFGQVVVSTPVFPTSDPEDITVCYTTPTPIFNLTQNDPVIHNTQDPELWPVTYFADEASAIAGFPFIINPAAYQGTDGQVAYAVIEDYFTGCKIRRSFTLHANPAPQPGIPANFYACDIDHNGTETFDLTANDGPVLNGLDPDLFTVTYHTSSTAANANTGAIATPEIYTTGSTTIFVRVTNVDDEDCFSVTSFVIEVNDQPEVTAPADVVICSTDSYVLPALTQGNYYSAAGGTSPVIPVGTVINSTQTIYVYAVTGTAPNLCEDEDSFTVTVIPQPVAPIMPNVQECQSYTLEPLSGANYYTGPNGTGIQLIPGDVLTLDRTVYIRAQSSVGGVTCSDQSSFLVDIVYPPVLLQPVAIETCDDISNDGIEEFNLIAAGNSTVSNPANYTITYYTSNAAAQIGATSGASYIANPAAHTSGNATVYIRVVAANDPTECYAIKPLQLIIHPHPVIPTLSDYVVCDDTAPQDGVETFDLTSKNAEATADPTDTVTYYTDNGDAQLGQNAITNPSSFQNTEDEQTIWVRVETVNGCADTGSFKLIVNPLPLADLGSPVFYACEETPGQGLFDLDEIDPVITGGQPYLTAYYENQADAVPGNPNYIQQSPYSSATGTIYALVTDAVTGCAIVAPVSLV